MIRKLIISFFLLVTIPACSECIVLEGRYVTSSGGEQSTSLVLSSGNKLTLKHETWQPGHYKNRKSLKLKGEWSCKQDTIDIKVEGKKSIAKLITIGENPLGIKNDTKALSFNSSAGIQYLANATLYPESTLAD